MALLKVKNPTRGQWSEKFHVIKPLVFLLIIIIVGCGRQGQAVDTPAYSYLLREAVEFPYIINGRQGEIRFEKGSKLAHPKAMRMWQTSDPEQHVQPLAYQLVELGWKPVCNPHEGFPDEFVPGLASVGAPNLSAHLGANDGAITEGVTYVYMSVSFRSPIGTPCTLPER